MKSKTLPLMILAGAMALGVSAGTASAGALPVAALVNPSGDVVQVWHDGRRHRAYRHQRQRIVVYPHDYQLAYPDYYATSRGFEDPGFAIRGNMPGCAVDLGYGRWESCDK
jgi:hypothetical protein